MRSSHYEFYSPASWSLSVYSLHVHRLASFYQSPNACILNWISERDGCIMNSKTLSLCVFVSSYLCHVFRFLSLCSLMSIGSSQSCTPPGLRYVQVTGQMVPPDSFSLSLLLCLVHTVTCSHR